MADWLSQEWLEDLVRLAASQPERPEVSMTVLFVITGGPDGEVRYSWVVEHGRIVKATLGDLPGTDLTMTLVWDDARHLSEGGLDLGVAFMQGRVKVAGSTARLFDLLPATASASYRRMALELAALTR